MITVIFFYDVRFKFNACGLFRAMHSHKLPSAFLKTAPSAKSALRLKKQ